MTAHPGAEAAQAAHEGAADEDEGGEAAQAADGAEEEDPLVTALPEAEAAQAAHEGAAEEDEGGDVAQAADGAAEEDGGAYYLLSVPEDEEPPEQEYAFLRRLRSGHQRRRQKSRSRRCRGPQTSSLRNCARGGCPRRVRSRAAHAAVGTVARAARRRGTDISTLWTVATSSRGGRREWVIVASSLHGGANRWHLWASAGGTGSRRCGAKNCGHSKCLRCSRWAACTGMRTAGSHSRLTCQAATMRQ